MQKKREEGKMFSKLENILKFMQKSEFSWKGGKFYKVGGKFVLSN